MYPVLSLAQKQMLLTFLNHKILSQYCSIEDDVAKETKLVCQFSSIGSLGNNEASWLCGEFYSSLNTVKGSKTNLKDHKKPICVSLSHRSYNLVSSHKCHNL
jgi:hypothetical protein